MRVSAAIVRAGGFGSRRAFDSPRALESVNDGSGGTR